MALGGAGIKIGAPASRARRGSALTATHHAFGRCVDSRLPSSRPITARRRESCPSHLRLDRRQHRLGPDRQVTHPPVGSGGGRARSPSVAQSPPAAQGAGQGGFVVVF
jgi:hypothetical protein